MKETLCFVIFLMATTLLCSDVQAKPLPGDPVQQRSGFAGENTAARQKSSPKKYFCGTYPLRERQETMWGNISQSLISLYAIVVNDTREQELLLSHALNLAKQRVKEGLANWGDGTVRSGSANAGERGNEIQDYFHELDGAIFDVLSGADPSVVICIENLPSRIMGRYISGDGNRVDEIAISSSYLKEVRHEAHMEILDEGIVPDESYVKDRVDVKISNVILHELAHHVNARTGRSNVPLAPLYDDRDEALQDLENYVSTKAANESLAEIYARSRSPANDDQSPVAGFIGAYLEAGEVLPEGEGPTFEDVLKVYFKAMDDPAWGPRNRPYHFNVAAAQVDNQMIPAVYNVHQDCGGDPQGCIDSMAALVGDPEDSPFIRGPQGKRPGPGVGMGAGREVAFDAKDPAGRRSPAQQMQKDPSRGKREDVERPTRDRTADRNQPTPSRGKDPDPQKPDKRGLIGRIVDKVLGRDAPERPGRGDVGARGAPEGRGHEGGRDQGTGAVASRGGGAGADDFNRGDRGGREMPSRGSLSGGQDPEGARDQGQPASPVDAQTVPGAQGRGNAPAESDVSTEGPAAPSEGGEGEATRWYSYHLSRNNGDGTTTYLGYLEGPDVDSKNPNYHITCGSGGCAGSDGRPFVPEDGNGNPLDCSGGCAPVDGTVVHPLDAPPEAQPSGDGSGGEGGGGDGGSGASAGGGGCVGGEGADCGGGAAGLIRSDSDRTGYRVPPSSKQPTSNPDCEDDGCAGAGNDNYGYRGLGSSKKSTSDPDCKDDGCAGAGNENAAPPVSRTITEKQKEAFVCRDGGCGGAGDEDHVPRKQGGPSWNTPQPSTDPKAKGSVQEKKEGGRARP